MKRKVELKMMNEKTLKETVKEIWEKEEGIKSAFYNACEMYLCIKKNNEREGYDEYKENPYLDMLWGGIIGVLSCSAVNEYAELELNYDGENSIWVSVCDEVNKEYIVVDRFNVGDYWVDYYKNGTTQYWEMANY